MGGAVFVERRWCTPRRCPGNGDGLLRGAARAQAVTIMIMLCFCQSDCVCVQYSVFITAAGPITKLFAIVFMPDECHGSETCQLCVAQ